MRLKPGLKTILAIIVVVGMAALLIWAFQAGRKELAMEQERARPIKAPTRVAAENRKSIITLDQPAQERSGIAVAPIKAVTHQEELRAYGTVMDLQPLVDLRNSFATTKAQLEKARATLEASRKEYERLKVLQENQNISAKVFQSAEATWRSDEAAERAAQTAVSVLEGTIRQRWGGVLARWLSDGSKEFERLLQREDVLLQITLPPGSSLSSAPRNARVQTPEGRLASATLVSPSPSTDPRIQGISLFYFAQARATDLLPGMNVLAYLPNGFPTHGIIVPASAVVWWQGKAWVYVQKDAEHFIRHEISTDAPVAEGWFIARGLPAESRLVVTGAQLLLSEEFRAQVQISD